MDVRDPEGAVTLHDGLLIVELQIIDAFAPLECTLRGGAEEGTPNDGRALDFVDHLRGTVRLEVHAPTGVLNELQFGPGKVYMAGVVGIRIEAALYFVISQAAALPATCFDVAVIEVAYGSHACAGIQHVHRNHQLAHRVAERIVSLEIGAVAGLNKGRPGIGSKGALDGLALVAVGDIGRGKFRRYGGFDWGVHCC